MKKVFNSLFVIIAAMVTFAGCAKQEIDAPATPETKTVQFFAESIETKTAFGTPDGTTYPTLWTTNDTKVSVALNGTSKDAEIVTISEDFTSASFITDFKDDESGAYQFFALSPASAKNSISTDVISANIWASQKPSVNSVDEAAMVLYSVSDEYSEFPASVPLNFKHFTAYGKLSFKNLNLNGAKVNSVSISSSADIAGRWNYNVHTNEYTVNSGASTITLDTDATENIWFACAPVGAMDGHTLKFTINTSNGPLSKEVTLKGNKYNFESGKIANIAVDMDGIEFAKSEVYTLVTDITKLTVGSKIIIAASESDVAMSTTQNGNNRAEAGQGKTDNTIVDPADNVEILEVENGASAGTYALHATKESGYIYAAGGTGKNNYLRTKAQKDNVSSWTISIAGNGQATIKCADTSVARNTLMYNSSNKIFSCYASGQKAVSIYRLEGDNGGETPNPTPDPDPTPDPEPEPETPVYSSLTELVAAGEPTADGTNVTVTLTNEVITEIFITQSGGYRNGVFLQVGDQEIEIYSRNVPESWVVGGTISGTLTDCVWKLYNNTTWELCPTDWSELTYTAPAGGTTEPENPTPDPEPEEPETPDTPETGEQETVEMTTFTATSASMDSIVSYTTAKGGGTTAPAVNSNQIRLYQNNNGGKGGSITITAKEGYKLVSVTIGSGMATSVVYTIDSTDSGSMDIAKDGKLTVEDINESSITFHCMGKDKNSRLYVNYLSVIYQSKQ